MRRLRPASWRRLHKWNADNGNRLSDLSSAETIVPAVQGTIADQRLLLLRSHKRAVWTPPNVASKLPRNLYIQVAFVLTKEALARGTPLAQPSQPFTTGQ
jgi:hypothetical protein